MIRIHRRSIRQARGPGRLLVALLLAIGLAGTTRVQAGLVLSTPSNIPATAGTSNDFFDVSLTVTGAANISAFQFTLDLPSTSGITFTSADITSPNYIFPSSSGIGWTLGSNSLSITAGDLDLTAPGYVTLSDTAVTLGRVYFQVAPTASGSTVPVTFDTSAMQTLVLDDLGNSLGYSPSSGSIVVTAGAVPEPPASALSTFGALLLAAYGLLRPRTADRIGPAADVIEADRA